MKLYVWQGILCDYTCGVAFALAENEEQARELVVIQDDRSKIEEYREWRKVPYQEREDGYSLWRDLEGAPEVYETQPVGFSVWGGS